MAVKLVIANYKGGVAKTTTALNISAFLALKGKRVLAMDFDPQANLTQALGIDSDTRALSMADVFTDKCSLLDAAVEVDRDFFLVPSSRSLTHVPDSAFVRSRIRKDEIMKSTIEAADKAFDYIVTDTASSAQSSFFTNNILSAADFLVIPMQLERFPVEGLHAMFDLVTGIKQQWINRDIEILGILATFFNNTINHKKYLELVRTSQSHHVFQTVIRRNTALAESVNRSMPITKYKAQCSGYQDYADFTDELIERVTVLRSAVQPIAPTVGRQE